MKTLIALLLMTTCAFAAKNKDCDPEFNTVEENFCMRNPSQCQSDRWNDWQSRAAKCADYIHKHDQSRKHAKSYPAD
jgi:hypothetical protein